MKTGRYENPPIRKIPDHRLVLLCAVLARRISFSSGDGFSGGSPVPAPGNGQGGMEAAVDP